MDKRIETSLLKQLAEYPNGLTLSSTSLRKLGSGERYSERQISRFFEELVRSGQCISISRSPLTYSLPSNVSRKQFIKLGASHVVVNGVKVRRDFLDPRGVPIPPYMDEDRERTNTHPSYTQTLDSSPFMEFLESLVQFNHEISLYQFVDEILSNWHTVSINSLSKNSISKSSEFLQRTVNIGQRFIDFGEMIKACVAALYYLVDEPDTTPLEYHNQLFGNLVPAEAQPYCELHDEPGCSVCYGSYYTDDQYLEDSEDFEPDPQPDIQATQATQAT